MQNEREIDALLSGNEAGSIIDRVMALPHPAPNSTGADEWDRAVLNRFQTHLVRQMRSMIDGGDNRRSAA